jgi:hypothetical protein
MDQRCLDIRLQMEMLITQREAMLAANQERAHHNHTIAYPESAFDDLHTHFTHLLLMLRS